MAEFNSIEEMLPEIPCAFDKLFLSSNLTAIAYFFAGPTQERLSLITSELCIYLEEKI